MEISEDLKTHLTEHIDKWPATKDEIVEACMNMSDIEEKEKKWLMDKLPEGSYANPEEVMKMLRTEKEEM